MVDEGVVPKVVPGVGIDAGLQQELDDGLSASIEYLAIR